MKIAITATEPTLDADLDPRFGRCPFFLVVDPDTLAFEALENPNVSLGQGAGIQAAQFVAQQGVGAMLTGNCGPNAHQALAAAGVDVIVGCAGPVRNVVEQFKSGQLQSTSGPNVAGHTGTAGPPTPPSATPGAGGGQGTGRGRGMGGGGRGQGRGRGTESRTTGGQKPARGIAPGPAVQQRGTPPEENSAKQDELNLLREQAELMAREMQQIQDRIQQLEQEG